MSEGRGRRPDISGMTSLKVDNVPPKTNPEDLRRLFEIFGEIGDVYIPINRKLGQSRGFAYVRFYDKYDAKDAVEGRNGHYYEGRELRVRMERYDRPELPD